MDRDSDDEEICGESLEAFGDCRITPYLFTSFACAQLLVPRNECCRCGESHEKARGQEIRGSGLTWEAEP
eukprot:scaffold1376_cov257-Pinguiococcus_pyrenoidosus.AAC.11